MLPLEVADAARHAWVYDGPLADYLACESLSVLRDMEDEDDTEIVRDVRRYRENNLRDARSCFAECMALLADVRAAGGTWAGYRHAPRLQLDVLRELCARDRAVPPSTLARTRRRRPGQLLARLFGDLPTDVFRHVLRFWRSGREEGILWE